MTENNELLLDDDLKDRTIIEVGRLKFNGSGASIYLPKQIVNALHLKKDEDSSLVILSKGDEEVLLVKNKAFAAQLKSKILDLRQRNNFK